MPGDFNVRVRVMSAVSETLVLALQQSDTVSTMLQSIEQRTGIPVPSQRLIHNGRQLDSSQIISQLRNGSSGTPTFVLLQTANMDASVRLCVRTVNNRRLEFDIGVQATLKNVKQLVEFSYGLQVMESTVLFYGDMLLEDAKSLFDYGITTESTVYMLPVIEFKSEAGKPEHPEDRPRIATAKRAMYLQMVEAIKRGDVIGEMAAAAAAAPEASEHASTTDAADTEQELQPRRPAQKRKRAERFGLKRGFFGPPKRPKSRSPGAPAELNQDSKEPAPAEASCLSSAEPGQGTSGKPSSSSCKPSSSSCKPSSSSAGKPKKKLKCSAVGCKEKLRLTAIVCRCGLAFCPHHRHAEAHACPVNYKELARDSLSKNLISACAPRVAAL